MPEIRLKFVCGILTHSSNSVQAEPNKQGPLYYVIRLIIVTEIMQTVGVLSSKTGFLPML